LVSIWKETKLLDFYNNWN